MMKSRRQAMQMSAALVLGASGKLFAQAFPAKPIRVIVGFAPGGANDILARTYSTRLQELLRQPIVVENRAGANSIVAAEYVSKAPADGYTLLVASNGALTINPAIYSKLPYDPVGDFKPIGAMAYYPSVLITNKDSGLNDLPALKALSARRPLNHGVGSSVFQLIGEYFAQQSGLKLTHINYKGNGPVVTAVLANEIDFAVVDVASALQLIQSGRVNALAVTSGRRAQVLPDVRTIAELGVPNFEVAGWTCLVAPAATPEPVMGILRTAFAGTAATPEIATRLRGMGMEPGAAADAALLQRIASERAQWTALAKAANIRAE